MFPGIDLRGRARRVPITDKPRLDCPKCGGGGIILEHSEWCMSETCEIMNMEGDCHGKRRKCKCWRIRRPKMDPVPGPDAARPALDLLIADVRTGRVKVGDETTKNDLLFSLARCDVADRKRKGGPLAWDDGRDHVAGLVESLCLAAAHASCAAVAAQVDTYKIVRLAASVLKNVRKSANKGSDQ
jgi:hypothetical protein